MLTAIYVLLLGYIALGVIMAMTILGIVQTETDKGHRKPITYCEGLRLIIRVLITWPFMKWRQ